MAILNSMVLSRITKMPHVCFVDTRAFAAISIIAVVLIGLCRMTVLGMVWWLCLMVFFAYKRFKNPHYVSEIIATNKVPRQQIESRWRVKRRYNEYVS